MRFVFLQFHGLELLLTLACAVMHILGFRYLKEPFTHEFFFCGLYFMFCVFNFLGIVTIFIGLHISLLYESVVSFGASLGFIIAAFLTMGHAERDFHLTYLTDKEEFTHPYFMKLRLQSIFSLTVGYLYLLHAMLTLDVYLAIRRNAPKIEPVEGAEFVEYDVDHNPTKLFMLCKPVGMYFVHRCPRLWRYVNMEDDKEPELLPLEEIP